MAIVLSVAQNLEELIENQATEDTPECSECGQMMTPDAFPAFYMDVDNTLEQVWCEECCNVPVLAFTRLKFKVIG